MTEELRAGTIVKLSPQEAKDYNKKGYVLRRMDGHEHKDEKPNPREYRVIGKW